MAIMNKLQASYLAGLTDGEGCIDTQSTEPRLRITLTDIWLIEVIKNSYGGSIHYRRTKGNRKDSATWTVKGKLFDQIIQKIYPYLKVKKYQAEIAKKLRKTFSNQQWKIVKRTNGVHKELPQELKEFRTSLINELRQAKRLSGTTLRGSDSPIL